MAYTTDRLRRINPHGVTARRAAAGRAGAQRRRGWHAYASLLVALLLSGQLGMALAQQVPPRLPSPAEPTPPLPKGLPGPPLVPAPEITIPLFGGGPPPGAERLMVVLRGLEIEGATVYPADELLGPYRDLVGSEISVGRVFEIAEEIQAKYADDGYVLTRVVVPAQRVSEGVFRLRVVEGYIGEFRVDGEVGPVRNQIESYLRNLTEIRPVRTQDLERYLLLANDLPGITAVGVLRPGAGETGAAELVVTAARNSFEGYAVLNNRGSRFEGPVRIAASFRPQSFSPFGERVETLMFHAFDPEDYEQFYGRVGYGQQLGGDGLRVESFLSYSPVDVGHTLRELDVETESLRTGLSLGYPVIRTRVKNLYLDAGVEVIQSLVDVLDTPFSRDALRVLHLGATFDYRDSLKGQSEFGLQVRQGIDAFGASDKGDPELSRPAGESRFTTLNGSISRLQSIWGGLDLYLAAEGQFAFDTLLSDAEFRVGGDLFGRGYDPSELAGDHGVGATAELRYTGTTDWPIFPQYQFYTFYDFGAVWNKDPGLGQRESLVSLGGGVRTRFFENMYADVEVARPMTRPLGDRVEGANPVRFYFQLATTF
jgi:hemolysin activation/secretion protein